MELKMFKALWGLEGTLEEQFARASAAGYAGIEGAPPGADQREQFMALLERYRMGYIAQVFTGGDDHAASFREQVAYAAGFKPAMINAHSARDCMTDDEQDRFYESALDAEHRIGIPIGHETHRQRAMFTPWTTARLLRKFPELRVTADFSHWVNVCESYLEDQADNLALAMERTIHIHGRVGYPEGPQVPHPAAPEYRAELALFTGWWRSILERRAAQGASSATFTAEFGPPGYLHTIPYTNVPVADLWQVNQWMTDYALERFKEWKL